MSQPHSAHGSLVQPARANRVLVIEDELTLRESLSSLLEMSGFAVVMAANGAEALDKLRAGAAPDVIVLDLRMPVMDGWEFRTRQRAQPEWSQTPVVVISAEDSPQARAIDAAKFIAKPFDAKVLLRDIQSVIDASEKKRAHEKRLKQLQEERMSALGAMAAGAAHEINNPLAFVSGNLSFLEEELAGLAELPPPFSDKVREMLQAVSECREGTERIRIVVQGLKAFSRSDETETGPTEVSKVLETSIKMAWNEIRHRATLIRDLEPVPLVRGNESRLGQVVLNLLINAAQAIPEGHVDRNQIRVRTYCKGADVFIEVQDTGSGISTENLSRIFDPFFTTKPVGEGTGLGLAVCHGIVESLGGELTVESTDGQGSTFRVRLPAIHSQPAEQPLEAEPLRPGRRGRLLVVDDEVHVGSVLKRTFRDEHDVVALTEATEALRLLRSGEEFDVILCDLMMPQITGMELYDEVRRFSASIADRMVFLTGGAFTDNARKFLAMVPNGRIDKPFDLDKVRQLVRERVNAIANSTSGASRH